MYKIYIDNRNNSGTKANMTNTLTVNTRETTTPNLKNNSAKRSPSGGSKTRKRHKSAHQTKAKAQPTYPTLQEVGDGKQVINMMHQRRIQSAANFGQRFNPKMINEEHIMAASEAPEEEL